MYRLAALIGRWYTEPIKTLRDMTGRLLTSDDQKHFENGDNYLATYSRVTDSDIFGTQHWTQFCEVNSFSKTNTFTTSFDCSEFNGVDKN